MERCSISTIPCDCTVHWATDHPLQRLFSRPVTAIKSPLNEWYHSRGQVIYGAKRLNQISFWVREVALARHTRCGGQVQIRPHWIASSGHALLSALATGLNRSKKLFLVNVAIPPRSGTGRSTRDSPPPTISMGCHTASAAILGLSGSLV